jgi:hypothetical protein
LTQPQLTRAEFEALAVEAYGRPIEYLRQVMRFEPCDCGDPDFCHGWRRIYLDDPSTPGG